MTIAGSDSGGGAGIQADVRTFAALGVHGTSVLTAITAQNTLGVADALSLPPDVVVAQINAILSDIDIRCAKTGMLSTVETADAVIEVLSQCDFPIVVDPVMEAEAGGKLMTGKPKDVLARLLPNAAVVTPNIREAEAISGISIHNLDDMKRAACEIFAFGPKAVVVTGGHLSGTDVLYDGDFELLHGKLIKAGTHGAGDTFSAAAASFLAKGHSVSQSVSKAKAFVTKAIKNSERVGSGSGVVNQVAATLDTAERYLTLLDLDAGLRTIKAINSDLIPERGSNLAMAISRARKVADVAAVKGRIVKVRGTITPVGCVAFGASRTMARVVLTALRYDPTLKGAMSVRSSDEVIVACQELNLITEGFDRADELEGSIEGLETSRAIESSMNSGAGIPDVIFNRSSKAREPMAYILGHSAQHVAEKVAKISSMII
ncbi:MAG: bifunctional hydroxymethylpyrimidine kinase/phosphomethylpyrimidine kinase [Euryarchaeota archaeon]|nr:bifunctional hydroxymethylpyrimidine kinase/phosphomethylpyrimidine kinase [Euryarchaeota archaeon]